MEKLVKNWKVIAAVLSSLLTLAVYILQSLDQLKLVSTETLLVINTLVVPVLVTLEASISKALAMYNVNTNTAAK